MKKSVRGDIDELLSAALVKRLQEDSLDKISIRSITDECGLNRQTFYYHFRDIYDLVGWILKREAYRVVDTAADSKNTHECIRRMIEAMDENRQFFMALYASSNFGRLRQVFMDYLTEAQKKELDGFLRGYGWGDGYPDFIARVVSLILTEFLEKWHKGQSVNNLDQFVERFSTFIMQQQKGAEELSPGPSFAHGRGTTSNTFK